MRAQVDAVYRAESRRVLATLIRLLGDFDRAEEAMAEAFTAAVEQWPRDGIPANPRAWLVSAGRFKGIDAMRRHARFDATYDTVADLAGQDTNDPARLADDGVEDDRLRLIFTCCHRLVADPREATATFTYQPPALDLGGAGVDMTDADAETRALLPMSLDELRHTLAERAERGSKDEKIHALNLDYMAKNLGPAEAERLLLKPVAERRRVPAVEFLRAKAHLLSNDALRHSLLEPRVTVATFGKGGERKETRPGGTVQIGPYRFLVQDVAKGGRKDVRLILHYDRVPSLLGLKNWLPRRLQRIARFRRDSHRVVS
jgi:hypothetical protein